MKLKTMLVLVVLVCFISSFTATAQTICDNQVGTQGSWTYEYWKDQGTGCMVLGDGGSFSCDWSNINNLLARKGLRPGSMDQVVTYSATYNPNGNSYLCIYGWTTNSLVEYYIVDSWGTWRPPGGEGYKGQTTSDGGTYDIYQTMRYDQPSIEGTKTFPQFWSVRTSKRTSGTITCGNHFSAWASNGMSMGSLYEVSMCVEGYQSSGTANITSMSMTTGSVTPDPTTAPTAAPTTPPSNLGDTNGDGQINIVDALLIAQYYVNLPVSNFIQANADTDRSGQINIVDALLIAQCYVGLRSCTF